MLLDVGVAEWPWGGWLGEAEQDEVDDFGFSSGMDTRTRAGV